MQVGGVDAAATTPPPAADGMDDDDDDEEPLELAIAIPQRPSAPDPMTFTSGAERMPRWRPGGQTCFDKPGPPCGRARLN